MNHLAICDFSHLHVKHKLKKLMARFDISLFVVGFYQLANYIYHFLQATAMHIASEQKIQWTIRTNS